MVLGCDVLKKVVLNLAQAFVEPWSIVHIPFIGISRWIWIEKEMNSVAYAQTTFEPT